MTLTFAELAGPADADMFRMTVDWGRWYIDPLPSCDIAEATEERWPSCSTVKKAADKDWSFLTVNRIAALEPQELHRIAELDHTQRGDAIRSHEKYAKNTAFGRGTIVHAWAEDLAEGLEPREITDQWLNANGYPTQARVEANIYRSAMIDFFNTYQPELVAKEYVTIHRTLNGKGYGATPDGLFRIDGETVAVDWKTRGEGSSHAAYAEEAAQIACGARAEYMIVRVDDHAERRTLPDVAGGYVVSIKPDGARLYPVDIDQAWNHWTNLHQWWVHKQNEKESIGRVKPKRSGPTKNVDNALAGVVDQAGDARGGSSPLHVELAASPAEPDRRQSLLARYQAMSDPEKLAFTDLHIDGNDLDAVEAGLHQVDKFNVHVDPPPLLKLVPQDPPTAPDEGGPVELADVLALSTRYETLTPAAKAWTGALVAQGNRQWSFRIRDKPTIRRYELYRGILTLAELGTVFDEGDIVRGLLYGATGREEAAQETLPLGAAISTLNADEAALFAQACDDYQRMKEGTR